MLGENLTEKIKKIRSSIVAIGFNPNPQQITIIGSGFCISDDGKILSCAHLFNPLNDDQKKNLKAFVMAEERSKELEAYKWLPIELINKDDKNDLAVFQSQGYKDSLLKKVNLGDSEKVEVGQDVYFIGFPYAAQLINDGFGVTLITNKALVSNVKRDGVNPNHERNWFILDAISNPGNSGCPLFDLKSNNVIGVMNITFRIGSRVQTNLDIREPMHICAAKPINLAADLLKN